MDHLLSHQWERLAHIQEIQLDLLAEMNKNDKDFLSFTWNMMKAYRLFCGRTEISL